MYVSRRPFRDLLVTYLSPQRLRVASLAVLLLGSTALQLLNPQILRYFIDTAVAGGAARSLVAAALLFLVVALFTQAVSVVAT